MTYDLLRSALWIVTMRPLTGGYQLLPDVSRFLTAIPGPYHDSRAMPRFPVPNRVYRVPAAIPGCLPATDALMNRDFSC